MAYFGQMSADLILFTLHFGKRTFISSFEVNREKELYSDSEGAAAMRHQAFLIDHRKKG
jgi:hypothetical protein